MSNQHLVDWRTGNITDAALDEMREDIGKKQPFPQWNRRVDSDAVWHFLLGIGDDNPLWYDAEYAIQAVGYPVAPPTYLYSCANGAPRPNEKFAENMGVETWLPGVMALWSGDRWVWHQPIRLGQSIQTTQELHEVREHQGNFAGRAVAQVTRTEFSSDDVVLAERYQTLIRVERQEARDRSQHGEIALAAYRPDEIQSFRDQYEREPSQRRGDRPLFWDDVQVGDSLGRILKGPLTITNLVGFILGCGSHLCATNRLAYQLLASHPGAAFFNETTGIEDTLEAAHWDSYIAHQSGMPTGYDFGGQRICWTAHLITDWCGDNGRLLELDSRLVKPNFLGDVTWVSGEVTGKQRGHDAGTVNCTVKGINQREQVTVVTKAVISLPYRSGLRDSSPVSP